MGVLSKGTDFSNGQQITDNNLDALVDNATFTVTAVDADSTTLSQTGAIIVKDGGIKTAKLEDSTGTDDGVTTAKIADEAVTTAKLADSTGALDGVTTAKIATGAVTSEKIGAGEVEFSNLATSVLTAIYPVGSVYINATNATNPGTLLGFGTWVAFGAGRVLIGEGSDSDDQPTPETVSFTAGDEGGEYNHTLSIDEMPAHTHNVQVTQRVTGDDAAGGSRVLTADRNINYSTVNITGMTAKATGGGQAHNNLQPYIVVHMWKRTA